MKKIVLPILLLATGASADPLESQPMRYGFQVYHDDQRAVTCWSNSAGLSCLPDSQIQNQPTLTPEQDQNGPTPTAVPLQRQHKEVFQL